MEVDGESVLSNDREDETVTEEKILLQYVKSFVDERVQQAAKEKPTDIQAWNRFNSLLCIGRNSARLRLISYIFGHYLSLTVREDIHLLRKSYLPDLVTIEGAVSLLDRLEDAQYLDCLKICYSNADHGALVKHLLSLKKADFQRLPAAIIVDDLSSWLRKAPIAQSTSGGNDSEDRHLLHNLYHLGALLIETANYCGRMLRPPSVSTKGLLVVTIDLNHLFRELFGDSPPDDVVVKQNAIIQRLMRQYQYSIDVDMLGGKINDQHK